MFIKAFMEYLVTDPRGFFRLPGIETAGWALPDEVIATCFNTESTSSHYRACPTGLKMMKIPFLGCYCLPILSPIKEAPKVYMHET